MENAKFIMDHNFNFSKWNGDTTANTTPLCIHSTHYVHTFILKCKTSYSCSREHKTEC